MTWMRAGDDWPKYSEERRLGMKAGHGYIRKCPTKACRKRRVYITARTPTACFWCDRTVCRHCAKEEGWVHRMEDHETAEYSLCGKCAAKKEVFVSGPAAKVSGPSLSLPEET